MGDTEEAGESSTVSYGANEVGQRDEDGNSCDRCPYCRELALPFGILNVGAIRMNLLAKTVEEAEGRYELVLLKLGRDNRRRPEVCHL